MADSYDIIAVGSGFASVFFIHEYLKHAPEKAKVLILERGDKKDFAWLNSNQKAINELSASSFENKSGKFWFYTPLLGGGSNCWWACTPRLMPNDFKTNTLYGTGSDWPLTYDELEPYYTEAESLMNISGPEYSGFFPRSAAYPDKPHNFSDFDRRMKEIYPGTYFNQPTARARMASSNRPACCSNGICQNCPINAKFTIQNGMTSVLNDPRVTLQTGCRVTLLDIQNNICKGVNFTNSMGETFTANAEFVALGANAIFNPYLMLASSISNSNIGRGLNEQVSVDVILDLENIKNFNGSTSITGHGYMFYDGDHRKKLPACLIESYNAPLEIRTDNSKWQNRVRLKFIFEDLRQDKNFVAVSKGDQSLAETIYSGHSEYAQRGLNSVPALIDKISADLNIDEIRILGQNQTENHVMGTSVMGNGPADSVIDKYLISHEVRNLAVLGSGAFPTSPPANPTLTICALSIYSARKYFAKMTV